MAGLSQGIPQRAMTFVSANKTPVSVPPAAGQGRLMRVAREHGVGPVRQYAQMLALRVRGTGIDTGEYYDFGLYDNAHTGRGRARFLGEQASRELNLSLSPDGVWLHDAIVSDKVALVQYLAERGMPTAETQATVGKSHAFGGIPRLRNTGQLLGFLSAGARYPLLAKPTFGRLSTGAPRIDRIDDEGRFLRFANGRCADLASFAEEVMRDHGRTGLVFQSALRQHGALTALTGPALVTLRLVTLAEAPQAPAVLYALACLPDAGVGMLCPVDLSDGTLGEIRRGSGPDTEWRSSHPVTGRRLTGQGLPDWRAACELASAAHALLPECGIMGWDIGLTVDGPALVSGTGTPRHALYQLAHGEGVMNPRFAPRFRAVAARQAQAVQVALGRGAAPGTRR